ncbi:uncharacterized protein METZ01_LOCUS219207 [marine metagenome]|uniref:Uncharacterized protein n=1 Tax=marine metagenome TaxID=408172 RepID=A0A382FVR7_9ZZZZ
MRSGFDAHVAQNREDFKEVHSRMSTMKREISDEINLTFEKLYDKIDENEKDIGGIEKWKWTLGGVMLALTFAMTVFSTFWAVHT